MRIKIINADGNEWYSEFIGDTYDARVKKSGFMTYAGDGKPIGFVQAENAEVVAHITERTPITFEADAVNSPNHYVQGGVEVIDIIRQAVKGAEGFEAACLANVIKYTMRYRHKNGAEDLRKSRVYLDWLIAEVEAQEKDGEGTSI